LSSRPVRALFVMPLATQRGGSELSLQQLLEYREDARLEPTVAFLEPGPMVDWCRQRRVSAVVVAAGRLRQVRNVGRTVRALAKIATETEADLIVSWMAKGHLYGGAAATVAGLPSIWFQAGYPTGLALLDRAATLVPAARVIPVSRGVERAQRRLFPPRPTTIVYPAVDISRFDADRIGDVRATRQRLGLPEDGPIFGSAGRLDSWKGFDVMLDAVPAILDRYPTGTFVLVGGAHSLNPAHAIALSEQARRLDLNGRVRLVGQQQNPEDWMHAMDVFVHGSQNEPFGMVVIEAMALGKAVVASAEGGPTEVITPGVDGLLSPYGDSAALAQAVLRFLDDSELRSRVGSAARQRASDFTVRRYATEFGAAIAMSARSPGKTSRRPPAMSSESVKSVVRRALPEVIYRPIRTRRVRRLTESFDARVVRRRYAGREYAIEIADPLAEAWYDHDWGEFPELAVLSSHRLRVGATVFDIGAHQGVIALVIADRVGSTGDVIAIEAEPHNAAVAHRNVELNRATNVEVIHAAGVRVPGRVRFSPGLNGHVGGQQRAGTVEVRGVSVDELSGERGAPDVLFIDVEGFELEVLRGASETLISKPDLFVEVHQNVGLEQAGGSAAELVQLVRAAGYGRLLISGGDGRPFEPLDGGAIPVERFFLVAMA
jgi:FkbM family methyltransferase